MKLGQRLRQPGIEIFILIAMVMVVVTPLAWFAYLPAEDGPAHAALAYVIRSLSNSSDAAIDRFYFLHSFPNPNLLGTALLVGLQGILSPIVAEKAMVVGFVASLALSVRYAIGGIRQDDTMLSLLAVPLGLGLIVQLGFYNFVAGLILFVLSVGYWQRHFGTSATNPRATNTVALGLLLLLTYLGHVVPYLAALFLIVVVSLGSTFAAVPRISNGWLKRLVADFWRRTRLVLVAALPSLVLLVTYFIRSPGGDVGWSRGLIHRIVLFGTFGELFVAYAVRELLFSVMIAAVTVTCFVAAIRQRSKQGWTIRTSDGFLVAVVLFAAAYLLVPDRIAGGSGLSQRIAIFTFIATLMWLAYFRYARWLRIAIVVTSVVATVGFVGVRWQSYQGFDRDLAEYVSGTAVVAEESTVLPLFLIEHDSGNGGTTPALRVRPLIEAGSYVTPLTGSVNLNHLQAEYHYSAAQFKPDLNARLLLSVPQGSSDPIYAVPPHVDILAFENQTGEAVDYVLLWGRRYATPEVLSDERTIDLLGLLDENYQLIFVSSDRGLMEVYARL